MAVSRKCCRKAVGRNRLKRLIRESFRQHGEQLAVGHGIDFVVLPMAEAVSKSSNTLARSLDTHWQRIQSATRRSVDTNNRKELNG
ncbi:MAG: ribonuclease P protein component [Lysobacterales bacterium]|jgi:ribonuclease P protein component